MHIVLFEVISGLFSSVFLRDERPVHTTKDVSSKTLKVLISKLRLWRSKDQADGWELFVVFLALGITSHSNLTSVLSLDISSKPASSSFNATLPILNTVMKQNQVVSLMSEPRILDEQQIGVSVVTVKHRHWPSCVWHSWWRLRVETCFAVLSYKRHIISHNLTLFGFCLNTGPA